MGKIKEFWGKLKYWQKGGIIGLIVGILLHSIVFRAITENLKFGETSFLLIIPLLLRNMIFKVAVNGPATISSTLLVMIWYCLVGILFGLILKYFKEKHPSFSPVFLLIILTGGILILNFVVFVVFMILIPAY